MEFLTAANASAQLEKLNGISAMRNGLVALCTHLSRTLEGIIRLPVLLAWSLFHQHKRLILQSAHQVMAHGSIAPRCIVARIIVPGNDVELLCPFEIVESLVGSHQVGCDQYIFIVAAYNVAFHLEIFQHSV